MKKIVKIILALSCFLFAAENASAKCNPFKPSTCVSNKIKNTVQNSASEGVFNLYLNNKCNDYLDVSIEYKYSHINRWSTKHYSFSPGERGFLISTKNRIVYITAKSSRNSYRRSPLRWNRHQVNMGARYVDYTYSLSCS